MEEESASHGREASPDRLSDRGNGLLDILNRDLADGSSILFTCVILYPMDHVMRLMIRVIDYTAEIIGTNA
jgi:hypothetical protein